MSNPCLYVFVNTDLESMNFGKAMAQSSHAANAFVKEWIIGTNCLSEDYDKFDDFGKLFHDWYKSTSQGFGTQLNLKADDFDKAYDDLHNFWYESDDNTCVIGQVFDPTYPFEVSKEVSKFLDPILVTVHHTRGDGKVLCTRNERTAFYIFGDKDNPEFRAKMRQWKLHP